MRRTVSGRSNIMKHQLQIVSALLAAVLCGCGVETPERTAQPLILPVLEAPKELQAERAAAFRRLTSNVRLRGVGVHLYWMRRDAVPTEEVMNRIQALGFNRIYCYVSSEVQLDGKFREFIAAANQRGIPVEAVLNQRDFYFRHTGNRIVRFFRPEYLRIDDAAAAVEKFNAGSGDDAKLAGITAIIEPHLFTMTNADTPPDAIYCWSDDSFGPDLDNACLMRETLARLRQIRDKAPSLPLTCAAADSYHEYALEGKLPVGKVSDFCAISPRLLLIDSGNKPTAAAATVENELAAMPENCVAMVGINLAGHTSVDSGELRRRDWNDLMRAMRYLIGRFEKHPQFEGFLLAPLASLEFLRMERD